MPIVSVFVDMRGLVLRDGCAVAFIGSITRGGEMKVNRNEIGRRKMRAVQVLVGATLALILFAPGAGAQTESAGSKMVETKPAPDAYQTFFLTNITQVSDLLDIQTDLRNMLPKARLYAMSPQNAISMRGTPDDIQLAQKMISELDRPRKTYRLTYTITETDNGKRAGTQSVVLIAALGQKTVFKQGSRVPIVTGTSDPERSTQNSQVQYVDVGVTIEATVEVYGDGVRLQTKIEQSSLAEDKSGAVPQDPVINQAVLTERSDMVLGKPLTLGLFGLPGTTRTQVIEVVAEAVR
jgi:type II secretory pathway component GspD/PulD (secretin)